MATRSIQTAIAVLGERIPAPVILILALVVIQIGCGFAKQIMSAENVMSLLFLRLASARTGRTVSGLDWQLMK